MRQITASPPPECRGISNGFFGQALTFAARSMQHTVNQLRQWAKEPDLGVKSFASSILSTSRSICLLYQGMILDRTSNSHEGFVSVPSLATINNSAAVYVAASVFHIKRWGLNI
jgi:hypothetical protein